MGFSLWASVMTNSHLINHATGWLEGGLAARFMKAIIDAETLRAWAAILRPISFTDDDLAVEAIMDMPPGGLFFGSPHTRSYSENTFWRPLLADWFNFGFRRGVGAVDAAAGTADVLAPTLSSAKSPALAPAIDEANGAYMMACKEKVFA